MPRTKTLGVLATTLCLMAAATAMAQQEQGQGRRGGGPGGGGFGGGMFGGGGFRIGSAMLIRNEKVQEELSLSGEQKDKLSALREEGRGAGGGNFRDMSEAEREKFFAEMRQRQEEQNKKVDALLTADQNRRLKEIALWVRGNSALGDDEVAKELSLSDEQKEQVKTIADESRKQMGELFRGGDGARGGNREKMAQIRKDADEEYIAVLTAEQTSKFAQMKGPKPEFELEDLLRFGGGQGGRGGPGGGQGGQGRGQRRGGNNNN